ncbi:Purple acid phosphatase 15 [Coccomyxa sp. Obi]|nr:Purple acid phosphatase 15 [Coccomyxa sp. Obi]
MMERSGVGRLAPLLILATAVTLASTGSCAIQLSTTIEKPVTIPWDPSLRPSTTFLPLTEGLAADNTTGNEPSQIHLSVAGPNAVSVSWASQKAKVGKGELTPNDPWATPTVVMYGTDPNNLNMNATGYAQVYSQIYNSSYAFWGGNTTLNYTSPVLHTAIISNLQPNTRYYYRVGDGTTFSDTISFRSLMDAGMEYPQRLLLIADWGMSHNSSTTLDHIVASALNSTNPPLVLYAADYSYADTWFPNGTVSIPNTAVEGNPNAGTYQPVWDAWQRFIQPLVGQVPFIGSTGNHEEEQEADGSIFKAVQARWPTPSLASMSPSYFFYSVNAGPTHNIILSNYIDYTDFSPQKNWLTRDLMNVDRSVTPWVTITFHNPWYTTDTSYKEWEQMRISLEPLTYQYGVDVFFYGHVHAYERTTPVYNYTVDPCGAVHITIGDGGNSEGVSFLAKDKMTHQFEDFNGGCPNVSAASPRPSYLDPIIPSQDPWTWYQRTLTFQADGNSTGVGNPPGYCYAEQPQWSQYRESSFGHGTFDALNSTHALWSWHANQDGVAVARDQLYIIRDTQACPSRLGAMGAASAPAPAVPAAGVAPAPVLGKPALSTAG